MFGSERKGEGEQGCWGGSMKRGNEKKEEQGHGADNE